MTGVRHSEIFEQHEPIKIVSVAATSFQNGVPAAHEALQRIVPFDTQRQYFGISWGGPKITYMAAASELHDDELAEHDLETFTIRPGQYLAMVVDHVEDIKGAIQQLVADPRIDPSGYCVEVYLGGNKTRCMVTLKDEPTGGGVNE